MGLGEGLIAHDYLDECLNGELGVMGRFMLLRAVEIGISSWN